MVASFEAAFSRDETGASGRHAGSNDWAERRELLLAFHFCQATARSSPSHATQTVRPIATTFMYPNSLDADRRTSDGSSPCAAIRFMV
jgi:hypothetical protein